MYQTRIDLPLQMRERLVQLLNARLADAIDLKLQSKQAHWNVKGPSFIALHELFDRIAGLADGFVDEIAERVTALGGTAEGTVQMVGTRSTLDVYPLDLAEGAAHVSALAGALANFAKTTRAAIDTATDLKDADTADLFTGISREADKQLWLLEAHLQAPR